jgi:NTE family protein
VTGPQTNHDRTPAAKVEIKFINLALQGGGAHGAFTWGVLDRLLEDERIAFEGISAASAGAINAAALAGGLAKGGRQSARCALAKLWRRIAHLGSLTRCSRALQIDSRATTHSTHRPRLCSSTW